MHRNIILMLLLTPATNSVTLLWYTVLTFYHGGKFTIYRILRTKKRFSGSRWTVSFSGGLYRRILSCTDFQHRRQVYRAYDCALGEKWKRTMIYAREVAFFSIYLENSYYLCHLFGVSELIGASYFASQNWTVIVWWNHEMYTKWNWPSLINNWNNLNFQTEPRQIINTIQTLDLTNQSHYSLHIIELYNNTYLFPSYHETCRSESKQTNRNDRSLATGALSNYNQTQQRFRLHVPCTRTLTVSQVLGTYKKRERKRGWKKNLLRVIFRDASSNSNIGQSIRVFRRLRIRTMYQISRWLPRFHSNDYSEDDSVQSWL